MKKATITLIMLITKLICFAQQLPPINCAISTKNAKALIAKYQSATNDHHPSSFIINTDGLKSYLAAANPNNDIYLHVYLAYDAMNVVQLVIVPSYEYSGSSSYILMHDISSNVIFYPCMDERNKHGFCYISDQIDALDQYNSACNLNIACPPISKSTAKNMIAKYQAQNPQSDGHIQSFTFSANYLRSLLTNPSNNIPYLQIYFGLDSKLQPNKDFYNTLVFVGLNTNGTHIYVQGGLFGSSQVYEECMPCPKCGVMLDPDMDTQPQLSLKLERKYDEILKNSINSAQKDSTIDHSLIEKYQHVLKEVKELEKNSDLWK